MSDFGTIDGSLWRNLPPEIAAQLLSLLPFKSLCQLKCVSPSWNSFISSPQFAKTYLHVNNTTNKPQKAILFSRSLDLYSVDFEDANPTAKKLDSPSFNHMDGWFRSLSSCNGLVLVSDEGNVNFLLNPSTGGYKELPDSPFIELPSLNVLIYPPGLGYVSCTDDYKVVMPVLIKSDYAKLTYVAVYSLKTDAWRTIQDFRYSPVGCRAGVCFNDCLHWLCWKTGGPYYSKVIVAFDLADEIFREVQLPPSFDTVVRRSHDMVVLGGCLCLLVWSKVDGIDVWMMMKYGVRESWTKFRLPEGDIVDVLCLSAKDELVLRRERSINNGVSVVDKLILYNPKKGTWRDVTISGISTNFLVGDNYIETLVSPNHWARIQK